MDKEVDKNVSAAEAAWVEYLNNLRIEKMVNNLTIQQNNFNNAMDVFDSILKDAAETIGDGTKGPRGGTQRVHGFLAEIMENGFDNADKLFHGDEKTSFWVNNNGPSDLIKDGVDVQLKFIRSAPGCLDAITEHLDTYPDFLRYGKYMIPRDMYQKIEYYLSISEAQANKMPTSTGEFSLKDWKKINEFFSDGKVPLNKIEPASFDYSDSQLGKYESTIQTKIDSTIEKEQEIESSIKFAHRATAAEAIKVGATSAAFSGAATFISEIFLTKKRTKKTVSEFTDEEWNLILKKTGLGTAKGAVQGVSMYALSNAFNMNVFFANGLITCSFGLAGLIYQKKKGGMNREDFISGLENVFLSSAISTVSSMLGSMFIPVPYLGAIIGNTIGSLIQRALIGPLFGLKDPDIARHLNEINIHKQQLNLKLQKFIDELKIEENKFFDLLENAFSPNCHDAFYGSIELARECGVKENEILKSIDDIDKYFKD